MFVYPCAHQPLVLYRLQVWKEVVAEGGSQRRVLTTQVFTQTEGKSKAKMASPVPDGSILLGDVKQFQKSSQPIEDPTGNAPPIEPVEFGGLL